MDAAAREYIDAIDPEHRPLFDRVQRLVLEAHPGAGTTMSYKMPTFTVGTHRLYVGVWKHGVSFYGWREGQDGGFVERHPELTSGRGTIRLSPPTPPGSSTTSCGT